MTQQVPFGGKPIVEAKKPKKITARRDDFKTAVPNDPMRCAFAQSACRIKGVQRAFFLRTMAYLEYEDRFERYMLPNNARDTLSLFDATNGQHARPYSFWLTPPSPSYQREEKRVANLRYRAERVARGEPKYTRPAAGRRIDPLTLLGVRLGSGLVHTRTSEEETK